MKQALYTGGVVGAGGAGFPTYAKLSDQASSVILNGSECEPLLKVDRQLMNDYVKEVLSGMAMLVEVMNAEEGIIAVKQSYTVAIEAIRFYIGEYKKLRIHLLPDIYPAGDEVVLIYETVGKIVPQGKIPIMVGCVVVNVETVLNIYRKVTEDRNVTTKFITIAGEVKNPVTVEVPIGITVKELIALAGGLTREDCVLIMGGPMTGKISSINAIVTKTTKAILALPPNIPPVTKRMNNTKRDIRNAMSVCSQCQNCTALCPRALLGHTIKPHDFMRSIANGITINTATYLNSFFCCSCGLCEFYSCHQGLSPRDLLDACKAGLRSKGIKVPDKQGRDLVNSMREERKIPEHRLVSRLGLYKYDVPAPLNREIRDFKEVQLLFSQNIGAPVQPCVKKGDFVTVGQLVGAPPEGALGACLHASISGTVTKISDSYMIIENDQNIKC